MGVPMTAAQPVDREALRRTTAPRLLCERARTTPDAVAFRSKHLGLYRERSWRDYAAAGRARGARPSPRSASPRGERVAIMGDACEEWMICDLAAQSLGAIVYGIYPTASASEVEYQMRDGGAVDLHRRGPGIRRQDPAARRSAAGAALDRRARRLGDVRLRASQAQQPIDDAARRGRAARSRLARAAGRRGSSPSSPPSSSIPRAPPAIPRARWSPTASISRRPRTSSTTIRRWPRRSTARSSTCRSATCSAATSPSRCR